MMKIKILFMVVLLALSGCTLVDPVISDYYDEVFVTFGLDLSEKTGDDDSTKLGFFYPGNQAANFSGDESQYLFEDLPFDSSNRNPFVFTDYDNYSLTEKYTYYFYINKTDIDFIRPQFYGIYRNLETGSERIELIDNAKTNFYVELLPWIGFSHYLYVDNTNYMNNEGRVQVQYNFVEAPIFKSISLVEYDKGNNVIKKMDASGISEYVLTGDRVDISARYIDENDASRDIFQTIRRESIDQQCYVDDNQECDYKDSFTYFVNGDGVFAKRMRIDFRK